MLNAERMFAAERKRALLHEIELYEKELKLIQRDLSWSAVFQRIGFEAALAAVTIGVAGAIGRSLAARQGSRIAALSARSARAGAAVQGLATVGRAGTIVSAATPMVTAELACATLGRMMASILQQPVRMAVGDFSYKGMALGLLTSVVGVPGPARSGFIRVTSSGAWNSYQGAVLSTTILWKSWNELSQGRAKLDREFLELVEGNTNQISKAIDETAAEAGKALHAHALKNERQIGQSAERRARSASYADQVPVLARVFTDSEAHLRNLSAAAANASIRWELWSGAYHAYMTMERAALEAKSLVNSKR